MFVFFSVLSHFYGRIWVVPYKCEHELSGWRKFLYFICQDQVVPLDLVIGHQVGYRGTRFRACCSRTGASICSCTYTLIYWCRSDFCCCA